MTTFESLQLKPELVQAVTALGFTEPTPIQAQAIPILLESTTDFVGLAQTGTGKTAAFGLPALHHVNTADRKVQVLILSPTRELCNQIAEDLKNFSRFQPAVHITAVYGGTSIQNQIRDIRNGVQIIVATPGRLIDLIDRKAVHLETVEYVILDEADEMLNMGFRDDLDYILSNTTHKKSTWLFSATMPDEVRRIAKNYMENPRELSMGKKNSAAKNIEHVFYQVQASNKYESLKRLVDVNPGMYGIIFTRTKLEAQDITEKLIREGYDIEALHGDLSQQQRDKVMARFREKSLQLLIATDVAARGIDVDGITHVINYSLPDDPEVYTHRAGRTARAGKSGICISIVSGREASRLRQIEKMIDRQMQKLMVPSGEEVCEKQFLSFIDKITGAEIDHGEYERFIPMIQEKLADLTKEDIINRVASLEFQRFLNYYRNAKDLNEGDRRDRDRGESRPGMKKLYLNLGAKDGFYKASFLQFLLDNSGLTKTDLGRIDMEDTRSFIEAEEVAAAVLVETFNGTSYNGRPVRMDMMEGSIGGGGGRREGGGGRGDRGGYRGGSDRPERSGGGDRGGYRGGSSNSSGGGRERSGRQGASYAPDRQERRFGGGKPRGGGRY